MAKRTIYDNMTASDLARITRERGLEKPNVVTLGDWAQWLAEQDSAQAEASKQPQPAPDAPPDYTGLSVGELQVLLDEVGIDRDSITGSGANGNVIKADLIAALEAHDEAQKAHNDDDPDG